MNTSSRTTFRWEFNPVIVKELRSRMRGARAFGTLTGILLLLGVFSFALYRMVLVTARFSSTPLSPQVGQMLFSGLAFLELMLICVITPAVTAGAISGEKEKLTYEMLLVTPLHPASILWGKLISALSYVFVLIFAAIPMASLVFIFGGVAIRDMVKAIIMLGAVAIMFGVIGLFISALFGRTGRATAISYLIVLLILFAPLFLAVVIGVFRQSEPPRLMLIPSPISALASALQPSVNPINISSAFWMLGGSVTWIWGMPPISLTSIPRPIYHYSLPIFGAVTLILYLLTTRLVKPTRRWQTHWTEALVATVLLLGYSGLVILAFSGTSNRYDNILPSAPATPIPEIPGLAPPVQSFPSDNKQPPSSDRVVKNTAAFLPDVFLTSHPRLVEKSDLPDERLNPGAIPGKIYYG